VALRWVLDQPGVSSAIIGASRPEQLAASLAAPALAIDPDLGRALDAAWWELPRRPVEDGYR
jgi:aryl-alcohol dehydrogenase (NADP+)